MQLLHGIPQASWLVIGIKVRSGGEHSHSVQSAVIPSPHANVRTWLWDVTSHRTIEGGESDITRIDL